MMIFRQRIAWILLILYLIGTVFVLYYTFEMNEHFAVFALEHVEAYHPDRLNIGRPDSSIHKEVNAEEHSVERDKDVDPAHISTNAMSSIFSSPFNHVASLLQHALDIPITLLLILLIFVYVEVFCLLWICTRQDPQLYTCFAFLWPMYIYYAVSKQMLKSSHSGSRASASKRRAVTVLHNL